jgi:plasmid stabilization system protein ParE
MAFRVETTPEAERDGEAILRWLLAEGAGETGIRWFLALEEAIASLANFPERLPDRAGEQGFPL